jgi:signal transduction histidine kinase
VSPASVPAIGPDVLRARTRVGRRWLDAPLRRKLLLVVLLVAVVWAPPLGVGYAVNQRLIGARQDARATSAELEELDEVRDTLQQSITAMEGFMILGLRDAGLVERHRAAAATIPGKLADLRDDLPAELARGERDMEDQIDTLFDSFDALLAIAADRGVATDDADGSISFDLSSDQTGLVLAAIVESMEASNATYERVEDLQRQFGVTVAAARSEVDRLQGLLVEATLLSMVVALAVAAGGVYVVTNGMVRRIEILSDNAERFVTRGRMLPSPASADEIGRLTDKLMFAGDLLDTRRAQAVAASRAKDEFLSRVSHGLKVPLAVVIEAGQRLVEDPNLSAESHADATRVVTAGSHLHGLIEELLDIKAIEAGQLAITTESVRLSETADDAIALVRSMPASRSITITADCPPGIAVAADRRRLREVLLNLLSNAVKYNCPDGRVELAAEARGDMIHIGVTDTGPGISRSNQDLLFQPFERLDAASTDVEGSGVGLALTKHVVEAMHGTIGVDSAPGRGSTFWFDLPTATAGNGSDRRTAGAGR